MECVYTCRSRPVSAAEECLLRKQKNVPCLFDDTSSGAETRIDLTRVAAGVPHIWVPKKVRPQGGGCSRTNVLLTCASRPSAWLIARDLGRKNRLQVIGLFHSFPTSPVKNLVCISPRGVVVGVCLSPGCAVATLCPAAPFQGQGSSRLFPAPHLYDAEKVQLQAGPTQSWAR